MKQYEVRWMAASGRWVVYSEIFPTLEEAREFAEGVPPLWDSVWIKEITPTSAKNVQWIR